jgi:hypothetical protein
MGAEELEELEERNTGLQQDLERVKRSEQEAARTRESLERQRAVLREEVAAATIRLERATQIRNTCKRLSSLECKLHPFGGQQGASSSSPQVPCTPGCWGSTLMVVAVAGLFAWAAAVSSAPDLESICRPPSVAGVPLHVSSQPFDPDLPPLMKRCYKFLFVNESELVTWGEAALHVCSRGTSDQSFLRRDDCDGCLCPLGSLWMHYKDPRFFGDGEYCVPEKQWKDCMSRWACCKHQPNHCWDFIFDGARQDPKSQDYCVVVDTCSQHMACYAMIRRRRRWELLNELRPTSDTQFEQPFVVGVRRGEIEHANKTLKLNPDMRGWGMPSSVLQLIKVTPTSAPQEWREETGESTSHALADGLRYKVWQLVSYYSITAKGMSGLSFSPPPLSPPTTQLQPRACQVPRASRRRMCVRMRMRVDVCGLEGCGVVRMCATV